MQAAMDRLWGFLERHRRLVLVPWVVLLLAAAPFAAKQTENLTGGGFQSPGSGSQRVAAAIDRFDGAQRETLAVVLRRDGEGTPAAVRAAVDRVDAAAAREPHVELTDAA